VPGIGPTVLATLLGELPELGTPIAGASPLSPALRHTLAKAAPGAALAATRAVVERSARRLTIAALTASRRIPSLVAMRNRMRHKGKAPKTIVIAVARQPFVLLTATLRSGTPLTA
jgi:transposase